MLKETWHRRMEKMVEYVEEDDTCRSRFLLAYFGQEEAADCGNCDICRRKKAEGRNSGVPDTDTVKTYINEDLNGKYTLRQFIEHFSVPGGGQEAVEMLRSMIDSGEVPPYS